MKHAMDLTAERANDPQDWLPPEAPLAMPPQVLTRQSRGWLPLWVRGLLGNPAV